MAPERRRERGEQLVGGELGLRLVVVDVVVDDDAPLGRLARLAGAQDDAHRLVLQLLADVLDELEPRALRLHHHVEQDDGHVRMAVEELARLASRARRKQLEATPVQRIILQGKARAVMHRRIIVDDRDLPARPRRRPRLPGFVVDQIEIFGPVGHQAAPPRFFNCVPRPDAYEMPSRLPTATAADDGARPPYTPKIAVLSSCGL